jgi:hypothetical protein
MLMTKSLMPTVKVKKKRRATSALAAALWCLLAAATVPAQDGVEKKTLTLTLGETAVKVNVYEKPGARVTFFAPHHDELVAPEATKDAVARRGGRLVELVSFDDAGRPARRVSFKLRGKSYSVDPNRIFTENGRTCAGLSSDVEPAVQSFAEALLEIIYAPGGKRLREGESFLVAVHNNSDFEGKVGRARADDLTADAFARPGPAATAPHGAFQDSAAGVFLSNREADADNFALVTDARLLGPFAERGFNVVLQRPAAELRGSGCGVDDGSLSVYSALQGVPYVNLEADALSGGARQREMLEAVYAVLQLKLAAGGDGRP